MGTIKEELIEAIQQRKIIYIYYNGIDGKSNYGEGTISKGYRTIEPYLVGKTIAGNLAVRAWQQNGASDSFKKLISREYRPDHDAIPGWRLFYVDGITAILQTGRNFSKSGKNIRPHYNQNDKQMKKIIEFIDTTVSSPVKVSGFESLDEPDGVEITTTKDDVKRDKEKLKKVIINYYELVTKHRKKSPNEYFLVYDKSRGIIAVREKTKNKYKSEDVVGNLKDLFIKYNINKRPTKSFFNNQRKIFLDKLNKNKN